MEPSKSHISLFIFDVKIFLRTIWVVLRHSNTYKDLSEEKEAAEAIAKLSERNEYEITSLNQIYLSEGLLDMQHLDRGFVWLDTGTFNSLMEASNFIQTVQNQNGIIISAPEEIAYLHKWIDKETLLKTANSYGNNHYGKHLREVTKNRLRKLSLD